MTLRAVAIVYVTDMDRSLAWYRLVLPDAGLVSTSPYWSELNVGGGTLALHATESIEPGNQVGVSLVASETLEAVHQRLSAGGIGIVRPIADEPFGRSLVIEDPDGLRIQVNEHNAEVYPAS